MADTLIQGNLDKGCGFYSILNAISEVNGMSAGRSMAIFEAYSKMNPKIAGKGYISGLFFSEMRDKVIPAILELLTDEEKVTCSFPFADLKFSTVQQYADKLRPTLDGGSCAIIGFGYPWNHWTAATTITDHAIILKDSTHHKRKMLSSLTVANNSGEFKEGTDIHTRQTIVFTR